MRLVRRRGRDRRQLSDYGQAGSPHGRRALRCRGRIVRGRPEPRSASDTRGGSTMFGSVLAEAEYDVVRSRGGARA